MDSAIHFLKVPRFFFSKQHGAYITLITCWLIAVLLSDSFQPLQPVILLFLLSSLNTGELLAEKFKRKTPLPGYKYFWLYAYSILAFLSFSIIKINVETLNILYPVIGLGGIAFLFLSVKRLQKTIYAEWLVFFLFSMAGLLALNPGIPAENNLLIRLGLIMGIYFGTSVFVVKARLGKISPYMALIYAITMTIVLSFLTTNPMLFMLISVLLFIKILPAVFFSSWYNKLKIKTIGFIEMGYNFLFILILLVFRCY